MTTLLGSASSLHRSLECPASMHLPQQRERSANMQKAADRGTALHSYAERRGRGETPEEALKSIPPEHHADARKLEAGGLQELAHLVRGARHEVAFAHHGRTGEVRVLGESIGREYEVTDPYETPGTVDVVIAGRYRVEVWDFKTGKTPVPPPAENPQLLHGALCAIETVAPWAEEAVVGIQTLKGFGRVETEAAVVTRYELADHEQRVVAAQRVALRVIDAIQGGRQPEVAEGPWCRFCDAAPACPAKR